LTTEVDVSCVATAFCFDGDFALSSYIERLGGVDVDVAALSTGNGSGGDESVIRKVDV